MKLNKWTVGLATAGLVSIPLVVGAEEKASPVMTALSSTTISGYVDTSAHWNPGTGNEFAAPFAYNQGKSDGFNLNRVKLRVEKPLSEENWAAGYRVDLWFGPDADILATTSPFGLGSSDLAIQQAYVALRAPIGNGIDFKMGVFDTVVGYESHDNVNNPNYTHSYGYTMEPTTHTGLLATYQVSKVLGVSAGIANTIGPSINARSDRAESAKTYMGSIALTAPDELGFLSGSTLYAGAVSGFSKAGEAVQPGDDTDNQRNYYAGATLATPMKGLKLGASYDYVGHFGGLEHIGAGRSYALYTSYQVEKWSFNVRGEYAEAFPHFFNSNNPILHADVVALTGTIGYDLWKNVLTRLEVRWDHAADGTNNGHMFGKADETGSPTAKNAYLIAANVIYKF